ncbi:1,4-beta-xylanase [Methylobacterium sp. Leaf399]|uniref:endo-1,4-beta-xylanase n=1 Tax=unclassified Methylobacterium TaxID=2615210 RepID=UPI0006FB83DB|nr:MULTISPECIES: endo-1,4-beta-xylanase [unclassified Methylobacterium]KQT09809.1 1,4-beta-xylanase [Methylobacterium sp. Leaf399]KQT77955.1 1,4-beta-xylanase [Methylobacterium sp. Leaf466]
MIFAREPDRAAGGGTDRRAVVAGGLALAAGMGGQARAWAPDGLHAAARAKGLAYGSAVNITPLRRDPAYGRAIARECGLVVAENEMKMAHAWPQAERPAFAGGDETAAFARANGQSLRGTTLVWHEALPAWARERMTAPREAEALMRRWIGLIAGRYRGRIESWDVVNEICGPQDGREGGLRNSPWLDALGPRYVDLAFAILREVDPLAAGVWNENDLEPAADWVERRRAMVLKTLEGLLARGVPVRRFGLQGHLNSTLPFDERAFRRFLAEIAALGLSIEITEFDVDDRAYPADIAVRDRKVSDFARRFLDVALDEPALLAVTTWDITNANTWLDVNPQRRRRDGLPQRALPLDDAYGRTPLWQAMRTAFVDAPDHRAMRARLRGG